ncbi:hypothetical protein C6P40_002698 [Pichia californica]|uniref:Uncharacterized protein n=1 Tax=Pichia californica TaxID=460514 RepID=A0A9P7BG36_9ASCO|nr:hypothetical protein C6P42_001660 [[Candida] californica]KAG0691307.1 hypothetical protein C6P40_002698 [[Candida] californica]
MGFITPGVHYVFDKKRIGRQSKAYNNTVYANENKNFINRYPNNLRLRDLSDIKTLYYEITLAFMHADRDFMFTLNLIRSKLQRYLRLLDKVEHLIKIKEKTMTKEEALRLLATITLIQGRQVEMECETHLDQPPLQATLTKHLELFDGGCILLNKYYNNQLTVDFENYDNYEMEYSEQIPYIKKEEEEEDEKKLNLFEQKEYKITDLGDDVLVKILSMSNNVTNISLSCKFFYHFVLQHKEFISYEMVISLYVRRYKLKFDLQQPSNMTDEHHHLNSHTLKVSSIFNTDNNPMNSDFNEDSTGNYILTRYRDPDVLTVISSSVFSTSYMTYQIYKSLQVDHVIPSDAWPDLKERYENELNSVSDSGRLSKGVFKQFWNEYPIPVPYLDPENPSNINYFESATYVDKLRIVIDLMISKTRFSNNIEDLFYFIVSLLVVLEYNKYVDDSTCIVPTGLLKNYAIYYMRQNELETENRLEDDDGNTIQTNDEELWSKIKFKNPLFYILLKRSASDELEEFLCPLFYGDHLKENNNFWVTLKDKNEGELIEEMINVHNTSPSMYIMNILAF